MARAALAPGRFLFTSALSFTLVSGQLLAAEDVELLRTLCFPALAILLGFVGIFFLPLVNLKPTTPELNTAENDEDEESLPVDPEPKKEPLKACCSASTPKNALEVSPPSLIHKIAADIPSDSNGASPKSQQDDGFVVSDSCQLSQDVDDMAPVSTAAIEQIAPELGEGSLQTEEISFASDVKPEQQVPQRSTKTTTESTLEPKQPRDCSQSPSLKYIKTPLPRFTTAIQSVARGNGNKSLFSFSGMTSRTGSPVSDTKPSGTVSPVSPLSDSKTSAVSDESSETNSEREEIVDVAALALCEYKYLSSAKQVGFPISRDRCAMVLNICKRAKKHDRAVQVFEWLIDSSPGKLQLDWIDTWVNALTHTRNAEVTLDILRKIIECNEKPRPKVCSALMHHLLKLGRPDLTLEVFRVSTKAGIVLEENMYRMALMAHSSEWRSALDFFEEMLGVGVQPSVQTYTAMINICYKAQQWTTALNLFEEMHLAFVKPNLITYTIAMSSCVRLSDTQRALSVFNKMVSSDITPTATCFTSVICACEKDGNWRLALKFLDLMEEMKILSGEIPYNATISAMRRKGELQAALAVLERMSKAGIPADTVTYNTLLSACERKAEKSKALALFHGMKEAGVPADTITYNSLISCCGRAGDWKASLRLFEEMKQKRLRQDEITFTSAITACGKGQKWEKALALFGEMERLGLPCSVISYTATINACEKSGRCDEALQVFELMSRDSRVRPNVMTFTTVIGACAHGRRWKRALEFLEEMNRLRIAPNHITYGMAIRACASAGQWERALEVMREMESAGVKHGTFNYSEVIAACCNAGQHAKALELYDRMLSTNIVPNRRVFASVLTSAQRVGRSDKIKQIVSMIDAQGIQNFHHECYPRRHSHGGGGGRDSSMRWKGASRSRRNSTNNNYNNNRWRWGDNPRSSGMGRDQGCKKRYNNYWGNKSRVEKDGLWTEVGGQRWARNRGRNNSNAGRPAMKLN